MTTKTIRLTASDGHELTAFVAEPETQAIGSLVLIQEILGITPHMQQLAIKYAKHGFNTIVPALFDRIEPDTIISYAAPDRGRAIAQRCVTSLVLTDLDTARKAICGTHTVAMVGYCWGGTFAYIAACELNVAAAISYYGTRVIENLRQDLRVPVQFHFGADDLGSRLNPDN